MIALWYFLYRLKWFLTKSSCCCKFIKSTSFKLPSCNLVDLLLIVNIWLVEWSAICCLCSLLIRSLWTVLAEFVRTVEFMFSATISLFYLWVDVVSNFFIVSYVNNITYIVVVLFVFVLCMWFLTCANFSSDF